MVYEAGEYSDALARLRKNAGEGNYRYTVKLARDHVFDDDDDFDEEDDIEDEEDDDEIAKVRLAEIAEGDLNLINIRDVDLYDLLDRNIVDSRNEIEQLLCKAEIIVRTYNSILTAEEEDQTSFIDKEWDMFPEPGTFETGMNEDNYKTAMEQIMDATGELMILESESSERDSIKENYLQLNKDNPLFICMLFEYELLQRNKNSRTLLQQYIQPIHTIPMVQLLLALESLLINENTEEWQQIIKARHAKDAMPQLQEWGDTELFFFWAIQIVRHVQEAKLPEANAYYDLFTEVEDALLHLPLVMMINDILLPPLENIIVAYTSQSPSNDKENKNDI